MDNDSGISEKLLKLISPSRFIGTETDHIRLGNSDDYSYLQKSGFRPLTVVLTKDGKECIPPVIKQT